MTFHDRLTHDLDLAQSDLGDTLDVDRLSHVARTQGTRALRRRRATTLVGGLSVVAVLGLALGTAHAGTTGPGDRDGVASDPTSSSVVPLSGFDPAHPGPSGPASARGVTAALSWAVAAAQDGSATSYRGQAGHEWYSQLQWTPDATPGISVIGVNVQTDEPSSGCSTGVFECQVRGLSGGSWLTTYEERTVVAEGTGIARVAELMRPDGVRVSITATNGFDLPGGQWDITRPEPSLSFDQLAHVAEEPFWGSTLPHYFLRMGRDLTAYQDIDSGF